MILNQQMALIFLHIWGHQRHLYWVELRENDEKWNEINWIWTRACQVKVQTANHYTKGECCNTLNFDQTYFSINWRKNLAPQERKRSGIKMRHSGLPFSLDSYALLIKNFTFCQKVVVHKNQNPPLKQSEKACMCF